MPRRSQRAAKPKRPSRLKLPRGQRRGTYQLPATTKKSKTPRRKRG